MQNHMRVMMHAQGNAARSGRRGPAANIGPEAHEGDAHVAACMHACKTAHMTTTVRIDPRTHAKLAALARSAHIPITEALTRAVEALRREQFFADLAAAYAASPSTDEDSSEDALWDRTLADGLESEPPYGGDA